MQVHYKTTICMFHCSQVSKTSVGEYLAEFKRTGLLYHDITQMSDTGPALQYRDPAYPAGKAQYSCQWLYNTINSN